MTHIFTTGPATCWLIDGEFLVYGVTRDPRVCPSIATARAFAAGGGLMGAPEYRVACAEAAKPVIAALSSSERVAIEGYANSEFWAGWNAAIAFAGSIARDRHRCWGETEINAIVDDVSACENIAMAIELNGHRHGVPVSRPMPDAARSAS